MKKLSELPISEVENATGFDLRHKSGVEPYDYLLKFLKISRQYGYATQDDTWGELEKELKIVFRRLEEAERFVDSRVRFIKETGTGESRTYSDIRDELIALGEKNWEGIMEMKATVEFFE